MKISYKASKDKMDAFSRAKKIITKKYLAKWKMSAEISYDEKSNRIIALGKGFEMEIKFLEKYCHADLKLSLILRPLKGKIESIVKEELEKNV